MTVTGPDVSHYQGVVDMEGVKSGGHGFVGMKTTDGPTYLDPQFAANRKHARDAGLVRLLYHFGRPSSIGTEQDARDEARWFCDHVGTLEAGEIAVLDIEDPAVGASADLGPWTLAFLDEVDRRTGRAGDDAGELYTYGPYARAHLRLTSKLADRHLWFAAYTNAPAVPAPWKVWTFWQYTSNGTCPGIVGRCDLNKFTGPIEALHRLAGMTPVEEDLAMKIDVPIDMHTGRGWAPVPGVPWDHVKAVTPITFQDGIPKAALAEKPALDGTAVVIVDLGGPIVAPDVKVPVLVDVRAA